MDQEKLTERLIFYNPWWKERQVPEALIPLFKRTVFAKIKKYLLLQRIILLKGPRRTGKSTLIYQLIDDLLDSNVEPIRILYLNFEDPLLREDLHTLLSSYEKISLEELSRGKTRYIFLDEIHLLNNWSQAVKAFFDKKYPLKFIASGSAASLLQKTSESLAGRTIEETVLPLSFQEWVDYYRLKQGAKDELTRQNYLLFKKELEILFQKYLVKGGFAHLLGIEETPLLRKLVLEDVIQKVIYKDLVDLYGIREPIVLEKVFYYLLSISGQILNLSNLGKLVGLNRETLRSYLSYLKQAYLYFELYKFSHSVKERIASAPKIHLTDPGLFLLSTRPSSAFVWETAIAALLWQRAGSDLYYWRNREEVDLVWVNGRELLPIEIKTGEEIEKKRLSALVKFMVNFNIKRGYVIYSGEKKRIEVEGKNITFFPAWYFFYFRQLTNYG